MFPWCDTPAEKEKHAYAVGDKVRSGDSTGTVVSADDEHVSVVWNDGDGGAIVYPVENKFLEKAMPWE